jgi:hypothetical protein
LVTQRQAELAKKRGIDEKPADITKTGPLASPSDRAMRSNPAYWAAFVLSGDGR